MCMIFRRFSPVLLVKRNNKINNDDMTNITGTTTRQGAFRIVVRDTTTQLQIFLERLKKSIMRNFLLSASTLLLTGSAVSALSHREQPATHDDLALTEFLSGDFSTTKGRGPTIKEFFDGGDGTQGQTLAEAAAAIAKFRQGQSESCSVDDRTALMDMRSGLKDPQRVGWTDRVFYHAGPGMTVDVLDYRSPLLRPLPDGRPISDHRPVRLIIRMCRNGKCITAVLLTFNISGHPRRVTTHNQIFEDLFADTACGPAASNDPKKFPCDFVSVNIQEVVELKARVKSVWRYMHLTRWARNLQDWVGLMLGSDFQTLRSDTSSEITGLWSAGFARHQPEGGAAAGQPLLFRVGLARTCTHGQCGEAGAVRTSDGFDPKGGLHINYAVEFLVNVISGTVPERQRLVYGEGFTFGVTNVHLASGADVSAKSEDRQEHLNQLMEAFESLRLEQAEMMQFILGDFNLRSADQQVSEGLIRTLEVGEDEAGRIHSGAGGRGRGGKASSGRWR